MMGKMTKHLLGYTHIIDGDGYGYWRIDGYERTESA